MTSKSLLILYSQRVRSGQQNCSTTCGQKQNERAACGPGLRRRSLSQPLVEPTHNRVQPSAIKEKISCPTGEEPLEKTAQNRKYVCTPHGLERACVQVKQVRPYLPLVCRTGLSVPLLRVHTNPDLSLPKRKFHLLRGRLLLNMQENLWPKKLNPY